LIVFSHELDRLTQDSALRIDLLKGQNETLMATDAELLHPARQRIHFPLLDRRRREGNYQ